MSPGSMSHTMLSQTSSRSTDYGPSQDSASTMDIEEGAPVGAATLAADPLGSATHELLPTEYQDDENVENSANSNIDQQLHLQPVLSVEAMRKLTTHAPITLNSDGINPNEQFKRKEKTKWTTEEGATALSVSMYGVVVSFLHLHDYMPTNH